MLKLSNSMNNQNKKTFIEIILKTEDTKAHGFEARSEIEDILEEKFVEIGYGEITGGGSGLGLINIDVEVEIEYKDQLIGIIQALLGKQHGLHIELRVSDY
jgi:hypothetical protein